MKYSDIIALTEEECDLLINLMVDVHRTRHYFTKRGMMPLVRKLKKQRFIKADQLEGNYFYSVTQFTAFLIGKVVI